MRNLIRGLTLALILATLPLASQAAVFVSVTIAPPILPVYEQPPIPGTGYIWTPGYWAWDGSYYWVPGTWVLAPVGLLWTPGYWGWVDGAYIWRAGYWGPHVGFYGGVNYGFGYGGVGFVGGEWRGGQLYYNRSVTNIRNTSITNVYNRTVVNNITVNHASFNGGPGGIEARPNAAEVAAEHERHESPLPAQTEHRTMAAHENALRASVNGGHPAIAATAHAGVFRGAGVVASHGAAARNGAGGAIRSADRSTDSLGRPGGSAQATRGSSSPSRETRGGPLPQTRSNSFAPPHGAAEQPRGRTEQPRGLQPQPQPQHAQPRANEPRGNPQPEQRPQREERQQRDDHSHQASASQARPERLATRAPQPRPPRLAPQMRSQPRMAVRAPQAPHPERAARPQQQRLAHAPQARPQPGERGDHRHG